MNITWVSVSQQNPWAGCVSFKQDRIQSSWGLTLHFLYPSNTYLASFSSLQEGRSAGSSLFLLPSLGNINHQSFSRPGSEDAASNFLINSYCHWRWQMSLAKLGASQLPSSPRAGKNPARNKKRNYLLGQDPMAGAGNSAASSTLLRLIALSMIYSPCLLQSEVVWLSFLLTMWFGVWTVVSNSFLTVSDR